MRAHPGSGSGKRRGRDPEGGLRTPGSFRTGPGKSIRLGEQGGLSPSSVFGWRGRGQIDLLGWGSVSLGGNFPGSPGPKRLLRLWFGFTRGAGPVTAKPRNYGENR